MRGRIHHLSDVDLGGEAAKRILVAILGGASILGSMLGGALDCSHQLARKCRKIAILAPSNSDLACHEQGVKVDGLD
jgi:hypothetical protein